MKTLFKIVIRLSIVAILTVGANLHYAQAAGLLKTITGNASDLHMKSHHVHVTINNGFARTEVDQVFMNQGHNDFEAIYSFPVPKQASLSELSLWIDDREIIGEVLEKERARKIYEDQSARGNDTALAEKDEYKTFDVDVYPVRARSETRVRLVYYQPIEIDLNVGRYVYQLEEGGVDEERIQFWAVDNIVKGSFKFHLELKSAFPVNDIRVPHYQDRVIIQKAESSPAVSVQGEKYSVNLDFPESNNLEKDIVFYYRLDDNVPARLELIPYREDIHHKGTFMAVVTPGASLQRIEKGSDWVFVLDTSASMGGNKIAALADGVNKVITNMTPLDRFRIVTFNHKAKDFSDGYLDATPENVERMVRAVKGIRASGRTALFDGLIMAYRGVDEERTTGIVLITDGVANAGPTEQSYFLKLLQRYDIRLFAFVMGNSANQPLLEALAKETGGFAMNISSRDDMVGRIIQAKAKVLHECIYDVELEFYGGGVKNLHPAKIGNLYMGQQLVLFGQYTKSDNVIVELKGKIGGNRVPWETEIFLPDEDMDNPELERLWALSSIEDIMAEINKYGETADRRQKVVDLATQYSLVTDYTSLLVIPENEMKYHAIERNNAYRVNTERQAQDFRAQQPVKNYRADQRSVSQGSRTGSQSSDSGMFRGAKGSSVGSGPVGPLFVAITAWILRRKLRK